MSSTQQNRSDRSSSVEAMKSKGSKRLPPLSKDGLGVVGVKTSGSKSKVRGSKSKVQGSKSRTHGSKQKHPFFRRKSRSGASSLKRKLWIALAVVGLIIMAVVATIIGMWLRGTLPTRAELPMLRQKFFYHFDRYLPSHLPEADVIGIDVSHYQRTIKWEDLCFHIDKSRKMYSSSNKRTEKKDVDFVMAKCTEGSHYVDSYYKTNKDGARREDILFGAYHFFSPSSSARQQARHFIRYANLQKGDMVPVLDVEEFGKTFPSTDSVLVWLKAVEKYYGVKPLIYTGQSAFNRYFASDKRFSGYGFWLARYGGLEPDHLHVMWQAMENGRVGGVKTTVDVNVFRGTKTDLQYRYTIR